MHGKDVLGQINSNGDDAHGRELASFGVSEQSLFPELESQAQAIVSLFRNKYARRKKVV
jgi:hypothetical protein